MGWSPALLDAGERGAERGAPDAERRVSSLKLRSAPLLAAWSTAVSLKCVILIAGALPNLSLLSFLSSASPGQAPVVNPVTLRVKARGCNAPRLVIGGGAFGDLA